MSDSKRNKKNVVPGTGVGILEVNTSYIHVPCCVVGTYVSLSLTHNTKIGFAPSTRNSPMRSSVQRGIRKITLKPQTECTPQENASRKPSAARKIQHRKMLQNRSTLLHQSCTRTSESSERMFESDSRVVVEKTPSNIDVVRPSGNSSEQTAPTADSKPTNNPEWDVVYS